MFRLTIRTLIELGLTILFGLIGLGTLLGTIDEYKARKAFNKAMDNYSARASLEDVHESLLKAADAKREYSAPQEVMGKLLIDDGRADPKKFADAKGIFESLRNAQADTGQQPSLPVLVGIAVADLEAARAGNPGTAQLREAITKARVRLENALEVYPDSGDLHVNLATVALLARDAPRCVRHLEKVREVGNISLDALPFLYNLNGLVAIAQGRFTDAVAEFAKVEEFDPNWEVPRLNLAAAYAQALLRSELDQATAGRYASSIGVIVARLKKADTRLVPLVLHALAVHNIRRGEPDQAIEYFRKAEKYGELSWHAKLNRAVAFYLSARKPRTPEYHRHVLLEEARPVLERALRSERAKKRDIFMAAAVLGTIASGNPKTILEAIEYFERAASVPVDDKDPFLRQAMPRVHRSLASLHYTAGNFRKALEYLEKTRDFPQEEKKAATMLRVLATKPTISEFEAVLGNVATEYDVRVRALLATPAAPEPVTGKNVRLTLVNQTSGASRELPFELAGPRLHALVLNLPQGRQRIVLKLTDSLGNTTEAASDWLDVDREPPRIVSASPAPGTTVHKLDTVEFSLQDLLGSVDFSSLDVILKYPNNDSRLLAGRGRLRYSSPDGALQRGAMVSDPVRCPVPPGTPTGACTLMVSVKDVQGRELKDQWSFTLK